MICFDYKLFLKLKIVSLIINYFKNVNTIPYITNYFK